MSPRVRPSLDDDRLLRRLRAGDPDAFASIHAKYSVALERYAARILGHRTPGPEDVVQDVFAKAHGLLTADLRDVRLRPWLYAMVRNRCLDVLRRDRVVAVPDDALDGLGSAGEAGGAGVDPFFVVSRKEELRSVVADVAALPDRQREVLLRRELDGLTHEAVAAELGITVRASKNLVNRARENLVKVAEARDADCHDVRGDLLRAHDLRRRASARSYRHVAACSGCRDYRNGLQRVRGAVHLLDPGPAVLAALGAVGSAVAGILGGVSATGGSKLAVTGVMVAAVGAGALEVGTDVFRAGDPAPYALRSAVVPSPVAEGQPVPAGTSLIRSRAVLRAGRTRHPAIRMSCPADMKIAGIAPDSGIRISYGFAPEVVVGFSRTARIVFSRTRVPADRPISIGTVCKRPDAQGSVLARPVTASLAATSRDLRRVCARRAYLLETPDGLPVGSVFRGQPVVVRRTTRNRRWKRIVTDAGVVGWVRTKTLCRR